MVTRSKKGKQEAGKNIAARIRKPILSKPNKFEQALEFAESDGLEKPSSKNQVSVAISQQNSQTLTKTSQTMTNAWTLMPKEAKAKAVLQQRAKNFAQKEEQKDEEISEQYIRFRLGMTEQFGVAYQYAERILPATKITRVPCTPSMIAGIVNYRGELLTVIDLKKIFHSRQSEKIGKSWIIIVKEGKVKVGLVVDEIEDNDEYVPARLAPPLDSNEHVLGMHAGRIVILNIRSILKDSSLQVDETVN